MSHYIGRFAPSPTGALHIGSLVTALASWLDAKAHDGQWVVRIEDVDTPRCPPGMDQLILHQLAAYTLVSDAPVVYQSQRTALYQAALQTLQAQRQVYRCYCTRQSIAATGAARYPGTCRPPDSSLGELANANPHAQSTASAGKRCAWRMATNHAPIVWFDRRLGQHAQDVAQEVGDFVLERADGLFAYQLAVVVDDAQQGITHVVRGADLSDNTARQILLQQALGLSTPSYLHVPLALAADGQKLSKQNGARPLDLSTPQTQLAQLNQAARLLGLQAQSGPLGHALGAWIRQWRSQWLCLR